MATISPRHDQDVNLIGWQAIIRKRGLSLAKQNIQEQAKRAEIEDLRFHDLRHEATSRFFEKGLREMQVAAITGHKTLQMLKRYTHLKAEALAKLLG